MCVTILEVRAGGQVVVEFDGREWFQVRAGSDVLADFKRKNVADRVVEGYNTGPLIAARAIAVSYFDLAQSASS